MSSYRTTDRIFFPSNCAINASNINLIGTTKVVINPTIPTIEIGNSSVAALNIGTGATTTNLGKSTGSATTNIRGNTTVSIVGTNITSNKYSKTDVINTISNTSAAVNGFVWYVGSYSRYQNINVFGCGSGTNIAYKEDSASWVQNGTTTNVAYLDNDNNGHWVGVTITAGGASRVRISNDGKNWSASGTLSTGGGMLRFCTYIEPLGKFFIASDSTILYSSVDNGLTWTPITGPWGGGPIGIIYYKNYLLLTTTSENKLYKSVNGGSSWTSSTPTNFPSGTRFLCSAVINGVNYIFTGINGGAKNTNVKFYYSTDDGSTFSNTTISGTSRVNEWTEPSRIRWISELGIGLFSIDGGFIFYSTNGTSWTNIVDLKNFYRCVDIIYDSKNNKAYFGYNNAIGEIYFNISGNITNIVLGDPMLTDIALQEQQILFNYDNLSLGTNSSIISLGSDTATTNIKGQLVGTDLAINMSKSLSLCPTSGNILFRNQGLFATTKRYLTATTAGATAWNPIPFASVDASKSYDPYNVFSWDAAKGLRVSQNGYYVITSSFLLSAAPTTIDVAFDIYDTNGTSGLRSYTILRDVSTTAGPIATAIIPLNANWYVRPYVGVNDSRSLIGGLDTIVGATTTVLYVYKLGTRF